MKCKYCQAEIDNDSVFCPNCGRDLSQQSNHCIQCGAELSDGSDFCPYCGTRQASSTPQSNHNYQSIPPNVPPKPMNPHKGQHRSSTSGIWWLIPALLLACLAGYLLFFESGGDKERDRYEDRRESRERDRDEDRNRDRDRDRDKNRDNQKAKEESDSTYQMEASQAKQDSLQNLAKGKQVTPKKEKKQKVSSRRTSGAAYSESSSQQRERSTITNGTKNLGYATFRGALKNGMPHDVNGRLTFKTSHIIDSRDPKGRVAEPGDYVIGEFSDGHLVQGIWYGSDHQVKGSIIIGK